MFGTVKVEIDEARHKTQPQDEVERIVWAYIDTAYNLMRVAAVRANLTELRIRLAEQGLTVPSDEEMFADLKASGDPEAPTTYLDLGPSRRDAALLLATAFEILADTAFEEMGEGFERAILGGGE